ncbi:MAG: choice-of-anchor J domain-containing protein [Muribaculaceae bacterium]|nr:choice-of-anchor J domain-containing protein [Muribaculaceae bacterium]
MNKPLAFSLLLSLAINASADVTSPPYSYGEDFKSTLAEGRSLPDGWVTYGSGETVDAAYQGYFGSVPEAPFFRVFSIGDQTAAWSCSTFVYANTADEWLVTPPIHINSDAELLKLTAASFGAFATNRYRVLISESGQNREDFNTVPVLNTTLKGRQNEVQSKESYISLTGYAGKDICLAFINKSEDAGLLGLADIAIAPYIMDVANLTASVLPSESTTAISLNVNVRTPSEVNGLKAELTYGGQTVTKTIEVAIGPAGTRIPVNFEDVTVPTGGLDYTVTLTPLFEGAQPTTVTGEISTPATSYAPVMVVEEFTGTWCTYCPRGAAFLNYYSDHFNGKDGNIKVIGIALHTTNDPMMMDDPSYLNTAFETSKATGYPSAFFNRTSLGDPSAVGIINEFEKTRSNSRIKINRVDYTPGADLKVAYEIENSYSKSNMNQRVALVMVENDVKGDNVDYNQTNGLSGISRQSVINTYGEELWPYFQFYSEQPGTVPFTRMSYDHVARGIWPDYYGELIASACEAEVPVSKDMSIGMPAQVMNPEKTAVIALLLDADTGCIIGADEVEAKDYNRTLADKARVDAESLTLSCDAKLLKITSPYPGKLSVSSIDGSDILKADFTVGTREIDLSALSGIIIVRAMTDTGTVKTVKYIL